LLAFNYSKKLSAQLKREMEIKIVQKWADNGKWMIFTILVQGKPRLKECVFDFLPD
jgi:hypothetical protein